MHPGSPALRRSCSCWSMAATSASRKTWSMHMYIHMIWGLRFHSHNKATEVWQITISCPYGCFWRITIYHNDALACRKQTLKFERHIVRASRTRIFRTLANSDDTLILWYFDTFLKGFIYSFDIFNSYFNVSPSVRREQHTIASWFVFAWENLAKALLPVAELQVASCKTQTNIGGQLEIKTNHHFESLGSFGSILLSSYLQRIHIWTEFEHIFATVGTMSAPMPGCKHPNFSIMSLSSDADGDSWSVNFETSSSDFWKSKDQRVNSPDKSWTV